ncbi:response regulator [Pseudomonas sp. PCH199]|uniref:response regulator n=1 Tax=unclassified Pseudomonas TaxID=196821 RepID=UPI000BCB9DB1|nr:MULTISPECIES: response regulator [unclassified Pseudomonas]MCW8278613.1 response regulator [Pseudomonas sp. PCH199]PAM81253.1 chemotaxis protein CheY [Pseudomonas sp. ERMR1:02]
MSNKSLRILIADEQHFNRLRVERWFNQLGCYRVAPVQSLEELLTLVEYASEPFDLLVINAALAGGKLDLLDLCLDNRQLDRVLIYDGQQAQLPPIPACEQQKVQVSHALLPDLALIQRLMAIVDPRLPFVGTVISVR